MTDEMSVVRTFLPKTRPHEAFLKLLPRAAIGASDVPDARVPLYQGDLGSAVLVSRSAANPLPPGHALHAQVALPVAGVFSWAVGHSHEIVDPNTALFIAAGQDFEEGHPSADIGHASAIVLPMPELLEELRSNCANDTGDPFCSTTRPATARGQLLAHQALRLPDDPDFAGDEFVIAFLMEAAGARVPGAHRASKPVVVKAKEFLHSLGGARLSLDMAARAIGVSPIYLTQAFKASEGVPLYRYYLNIRLSQALGRLPHCDSITVLALELGFSSHSHFSAAFISRFGVSPSAYRELSGTSGLLRAMNL